MTSSTHTSTFSLAKTIRLPPQSQETWPDPLSSIFSPATVYMETKKKKFWCITGPARDAYDTVRDVIKDSLKDREDLYQGQDESYVPHTIQCLMVGRTAETARPYLVISCHQKALYRKAKKIIRECEWWNHFLHDHPGFGGFEFIELKHGPRRMADGKEDDPKHWIYTTDRADSFYGAPIFSASGMLGPTDNFSPQQARLGGIIDVDGQPFALTAAHPFASRKDDSASSRPWHTSGTEYSAEESGGETSSESDSDEPSLTSESSSESAHQPQFSDGFPELVGQVACSSGGSPADGLDWTLVRLAATSQVRRMLSKTRQDRGFTSSVRSEVGIDLLQPSKIGYLSEQEILVFTTGGMSGLVEGTLSPSKALVCFPGAHEYLSLHIVVLKDQVAPGDCGQWIVDSAGNWYGHIVGGNPESGVAYMSSAVSIVNDVQTITSARSLSLWKPREYTEAPTYGSSVRHVGSSGDLESRESWSLSKPLLSSEHEIESKESQIEEIPAATRQPEDTVEFFFEGDGNDDVIILRPSSPKDSYARYVNIYLDP